MDNNTNKIEEELRHYKLYKIQNIEKKMREYRQVYTAIKENVVFKKTKNVSSKILRIILFIISFFVLVSGIIMLISPSMVISIIKFNEILIEVNDENLHTIITFSGAFLTILSATLLLITSLLKRNIEKRNIIFEISELVNDVINYMDEDVKEGKRKYEYFIDNMADVEHRKKNK